MWILLIVILIGIVFGVYKYRKWCKEEELKEKQKAEKARKQKEMEQWQNKRKKIYKNHLPNIYKGLSKSQLEQVYSLLQTIYENDSATLGDNWTAATTAAWADAEDRLKKFLGYPKWNIGNGWSDGPLWPVIDMNYIYRNFLS